MMKIDNSLLTDITGEPFADAGGEVINYLFKQFPGKDIYQLIEYVADIYINKFDCKLHIYFLNHPVTQAAWDKKRRLSETVNYYKNGEGVPGTCSITGKQGTVYYLNRSNSFLTGSGTFVNFHANLAPGVPVCKEMLIRMFFAPLGMIRLGKRIATIHSNKQEINRFFVEKNCDENLKEGADAFVSVSGFDLSGYTFHFLGKVIEQGIDGNTPSSFTVYYFTNYATEFDIEINHIDWRIFYFYKSVYYSDKWWKFIGQYDKEMKAKTGDYIYNEIIFDLFKGNNILPKIRKFCEKEYYRGSNFDWNAVSQYLSTRN